MGNKNSSCNNCRNPRNDVCLDNVPLGMGYVPWQTWDDIYDLNKSLDTGTIFPCLDKPFLGRWPSK